MKKLLLLLFMCLTLNSFAQLNQVGRDKYYHAGAGAIISGGMYTIGQYSQREMNPIAPILVVSFVAMGKETFDAMSGGRFSGKDMLWTCASGAVVNLALHLIWDRKKLHRRSNRATYPKRY